MKLSEKKALVKRLFDEVSRKYFSHLPLRRPYPKFQVRQMSRAFGSFSPSKVTITIHPDVFLYPEVLKSVVWHEAIHYYDYDYDSAEHKINGGHGKFFVDMMNLINKKEGKKLITISEDVTATPKTSKPFYVYGMIHNGTYYFIWSRKKDDLFLWKIANSYHKPKQVFEMKTNNVLFRYKQSATPTSIKKYYGAGEELEEIIRRDAKIYNAADIKEPKDENRKEYWLYVFQDSFGKWKFFWSRSKLDDNDLISVKKYYDTDKVFRVRTNSSAFLTVKGSRSRFHITTATKEQIAEINKILT